MPSDHTDNRLCYFCANPYRGISDFMRAAAADFPAFDFAENVGYGTKSHLTALEARCITPLHRRNFAPVTRFAELNHYFQFES